ncbi:MAG: hypothetical protein WC869_10530 [Phycisphaerae bacterium]|jgi:hypothetical protein
MDHNYSSTCPGCGKDCSSTALVELVYTFEVCHCEPNEPGGGHLVETTWHKDCYAAPIVKSTTEAIEAQLIVAIAKG